MWKGPSVGNISDGINGIIEQVAPRGAMRDRNYRLGVLNGLFAYLGDALLNPSIVITSFAAKLGAANVVIGLLPALMQAGSLLPQVFLASYVARLPRKVVLYRNMATLRISGLVVMALSAFLLGGNPQLLLAGFVLGMCMNALFSGISSLAWWETSSKIVTTEKRAAFFGLRNLLGGVLAFGAGFAVRAILGLDWAFPYPYAVLFTLGALAFGIGWYFFGLVDEPPDQHTPEPARLSVPLRDPAFQRFLRVRLLYAVASMVEPFYAAYAVRSLDLGREVGLFLTLYALAALVSNLVWVRLANRFGSRSLMITAGCMAAFTPLLALIIRPEFYPVVFVMQGIYLTGLGLAYATYLLNLAPTEQRSSYIGLANTVVGVFAFSPVLGGWLADQVNYGPLMLASAALYGLGAFAGRKLQREW